ncbi:hypothetical protein JXM67_12060 [candidate division WOR-3 bacterium]|nr:hypothetical protein [candidate division WOR-3 bacterium]
MRKIIACIENLRSQLDRRRKEVLTEFPTRTVFINPMLEALGWDVRDPDIVQLEYPTIGGGHVDYAAKINRKPVLYIEAKPLNDSLDVKAITQIVGYAASDGVEWCVLTNGVTYKVYSSTEKAEAPKKLLYEISIDSKGSSINEIAEKLNRLSKTSMEAGLLDEMGEEIFTLGKVRATLERLFEDSPDNFVRLVRAELNDAAVKPMQIKRALPKLANQILGSTLKYDAKVVTSLPSKQTGKETYNEDYHIGSLPVEIVELYRALDSYCMGFDPGNIRKKAAKLYLNFIHGKKAIFCCVVPRSTGLNIHLKLDYSELQNPTPNIRDVSNIGHWGVGDVEIMIDDWDKLQSAKPFIQQSFEKNKEKDLPAD